MGSTWREPGHRDDEQPHLVQLTRPISVGLTEVTRAQYVRVMGGLPPGVSAEPGDLPVDRVTWDEADKFCQRLGDIDGRHYCLPTEAEWEYACRAGTTGPFGTIRARLEDTAWYAGNSGGSLHPAGTKAANHWGIHDMLGNVAELTADSYVPYLGSAERTDPTFKTAGPDHVVRGGNFADAAEDCRAAYRTFALTPSRGSAVGFRVVVDRVATRVK
jgi:formylglycine-generating enzyme required for sulfatase activity